MADIKIMKAVEFDKLPAKFKKQYPDLASLERAGYWLQKKYDGCFALCHVVRGGGGSVTSRTGEDYTTSCRHILDELHEAAEGTFNGDWDEFLVIGEVWIPGLDFPTISGKFRKRAASDLRLVANDLLPLGLVTQDPYYMRYQRLIELLPEPDQFDQVVCTVAKTYKAHEWVDALGMANKWKAEGGFDGAILRNPQAGYTIGLVKNGEIVKVKPVMSLDLRCVGLNTAVGAKTGRAVYTIVVEYKGIRTEVGSGMPHRLDQCPKVGDIVEVECMGLTEDGKLREPRFKGVRYDKDTPDA